MIRLFALIAAAALLLSFAPAGQTKPHCVAADTPPESKLKKYWLVLLRRGANRGQDSIAAAKIQAAHMRNINQMAADGALIMAGPIGSPGDLRGIFIIDAPDSLAVAALVNRDSAVVTGRLRMEIFPWWSEKGTYIFK